MNGWTTDHPPVQPPDYATLGQFAEPRLGSPLHEQRHEVADRHIVELGARLAHNSGNVVRGHLRELLGQPVDDLIDRPILIASVHALKDAPLHPRRQARPTFARPDVGPGKSAPGRSRRDGQAPGQQHELDSGSSGTWIDRGPTGRLAGPTSYLAER